MKTIWRTIKWSALIAVTLAAIAAVYLYRNIDSQLKVFVQNKLSQQLPGFVTEIDSAQFIPSKGIILRGIGFSVPGKYGKAEQILTVQEAFITCDVDLQTILSGNAKPTAIKLQKLILHLTQCENGQFLGWEQLQTLNIPSDDSCPIEICESEIIFRDLQKPNAKPIWLTGLNIRLTPSVRKNANWEISGKMTNPNMGSVECAAKYSPQTRNLTLSGTARKIIVDQEYIPYLPKLPIENKTLESFQAKLDFQFEAEYDPRKNEHLPFATLFHVQGSLYDGKVLFPPIVKYPILNLGFGFDVTHDALQINSLSAASGVSHLKLNWQQTGLFPVRRGKLEYHVGQFVFDTLLLPSLAPFLPQRLNDQLEHFQAEGQAGLSGVIHYDGRNWGIESTDIELENFAVTCAKFPYRLDYLHGTISIAPCEMQTQDGRRFSEEAMTLKLQSQDMKTVIDGTMYQIMSGRSFGQFVITAKNVVIGDRLMQAVPSSQQAVVKSLHAEGNFDGKLEVTLPGSVKHDGEASPDLLLHLMPQNCSVNYEKFRLPLRNVCGIIQMRNGHWTFGNLKAENGSSVILGNGHLLPTATDGIDFQLNLTSQGLKLNDELIGAFEKSHRQLLTDLRLSGRADVNLTLKYLSDTQDFHVAFDAVTDPDVTTIKPKDFPLQLDKVTCRIRYADGMVRVNDFRGCKGDAFLSTNLSCVFHKDGAWVMSLDNLLAESFEHNTDLSRAMPSDLQNFITKLQLKEPVTLRGTLCFQKDAAVDSPLRSYWNVGIICHQNSATMGVPLTNICGKVDVLGKNDENGILVFGKLGLDSVNYGDYQLTNVRGPFSFRDNEIILGRRSLLPDFVEPTGIVRQTGMNTSTEFDPMVSQPVVRNDAQVAMSMQPAFHRHDPSRLPLLSLTFSPNHVEQEMPIVASAYDGTLWLDGQVFQLQSMSYRYLLTTGLRDVDLERVTRETLAEQPFKGKLSGNIELEGGTIRESMKGGGELALRDADIYKLPTMQRIMQMFGVRSRDDDQSAICSSDIAFSLQGNHVTLSDVKLEGNVLSLSGEGKMDMEDLSISLKLGTQLTREESRLPLIGTAIDVASKQITEIHVGGTLKSGELSVRTQALPRIRDALQTQQDGQQGRSRPVMDYFRNTFKP
ncbi:MAG: AsmA-like C-terminal region-containing protein [Planctomycetaceae bacterium]|nr:AsmA-like C-terminal region-containing protein [Planctomycetaceae bacterium]